MISTPNQPFLNEITNLVRSVDIGPEASRLAVRLTRLLARGHPLSDEQVAAAVDDLGIDPAQAAQHLTAYAERNDRGEIIGVAPGITLRPTAHSFTTDTAQLWAWCALDTLLIPAVLGQQARVASVEPRSQETVRFTVSSDGVRDIEPADAVMSLPGLVPGDDANDPRHLAVDLAQVTVAEEIWRTYCHHSHAFTSPEAARQHFADRDDIALLTLPDAFDVVREAVDNLLAHE